MTPETTLLTQSGHRQSSFVALRQIRFQCAGLTRYDTSSQAEVHMKRRSKARSKVLNGIVA